MTVTTTIAVAGALSKFTRQPTTLLWPFCVAALYYVFVRYIGRTPFTRVLWFGVTLLAIAIFSPLAALALSALLLLVVFGANLPDACRDMIAVMSEKDD